MQILFELHPKNWTKEREKGEEEETKDSTKGDVAVTKGQALDLLVLPS